jgi:hypothetical protein
VLYPRESDQRRTSRIRYGVQVEFTVDNILDGGPSKADIRKGIRRVLEELRDGPDDNPLWGNRFRSLSDVRIKYLHEATGGKHR